MRFLMALWLGKAINFLINIIDKSRGSNFSGEKALKVCPVCAHPEAYFEVRKENY